MPNAAALARSRSTSSPRPTITSVASGISASTRGHTMFHRHSAGSIGYAEFRHLGKEGGLGKYPIHIHMVGDTMRGSSIVGA